MSSGKWSMQNTVNWWIPCWGNAYMTSKNLEEERAGRRWARRVWSKSACFSTLLEPWNTASLGLEATQEGSTPTSCSEQASCETRLGCSGLCLVRSQKKPHGWSLLNFPGQTVPMLGYSHHEIFSPYICSPVTCQLRCDFFLHWVTGCVLIYQHRLQNLLISCRFRDTIHVYLLTKFKMAQTS